MFCNNRYILYIQNVKVKRDYCIHNITVYTEYTIANITKNMDNIYKL